MPKVKSFKDHNGKRGKVGSVVYSWHLDIGERSSDEEKRSKSKVVESIVTMGAGGTKVKFSGELGYSPANQYVILESE